MTHSSRAAPALRALADADPALGVLSLWCRHKDSDAPTRTGGDTIHYGPDFAQHDLPRQVGMAAHHVLHVVLRHPNRMADLRIRLGPRYDPQLFGIAADAIVNEALILAGHALPRPFVSLTGVLKAAGLDAPSPQAALSQWDCDKLVMTLHADQNRAQKVKDHGAQQGFAPDLNEADADAGHVSEATEAEWRAHTARAMEAGRGAGTGIGTLAALIADLAPPRVPWEQRLRGLMARALLSDPGVTYRRPAGRWVAQEATARARQAPAPPFEPGRARHKNRPRIALCLDTSSSIDDLTLDLFGAEVAAIAARTGAETHLIAFDEAVYLETRLPDGRGPAIRDLSLRRGGGTAFDPALARARQLNPSIVIVMTDLDGPIGPQPAPAPVLWAVPETVSGDPPFGTRVDIPVLG